MIYVLDAERRVVPAEGPVAWVAARDRARHDGSWTVDSTSVGSVVVMTVFVGMLRMPYVEGDPPPVFDTLLVEPGSEEEPAVLRRYATWAEAEAGHVRFVLAARDGRLRSPPRSS